MSLMCHLSCSHAERPDEFSRARQEKCSYKNITGLNVVPLLPEQHNLWTAQRRQDVIILNKPPPSVWMRHESSLHGNERDTHRFKRTGSFFFLSIFTGV